MKFLFFRSYFLGSNFSVGEGCASRTRDLSPNDGWFNPRALDQFAESQRAIGLWRGVTHNTDNKPQHAICENTTGL